MENQDVVTPVLQGIIVLIGIVLTVLVTTNFTGIIIHYFFLRHEIEEIEDDDLQVDLLQSLDAIFIIFFRTIILHNESDFFNDRKVFRKLIKYRLGNSSYTKKKDNLIVFEPEEEIYAKEEKSFVN